MSQCIENLITNALKYSGDERWVGIRARAVEGGKDGAAVHISVSDRGIGIAPEDLPHIFEPFFRSPTVRRSQVHGTGLGLALAKQVAESMGGALTVETTPGSGSTFTLTLRCADGAVATTAAGTVEGPLFTTSLHPPRHTAG